MRLAGLDISKNKIGLAFSDDECIFVAHSFLITGKTNKNHKVLLENYYKEYKPSLTIIGLPGWGQNREYIKSFVHSSRNLLQPYVFIDELYSTELTEYYNASMNKDECAARIFVYFALKNWKTIEYYKTLQIPPLT